MNSTSIYTSPYEPSELDYFNQSAGVLGDADRESSSSPNSPSMIPNRNTSSLSPEIEIQSDGGGIPNSVRSISPRREDEPVYANLAEMASTSASRSCPPQPEVGDTPRRVLGAGWTEYVNETGRSYFFNSETGRCQWIPPRLMRSPSQIKAFLDATKQMELLSSSQTGNSAENKESSRKDSDSSQCAVMDTSESIMSFVGGNEAHVNPDLNSNESDIVEQSRNDGISESQDTVCQLPESLTSAFSGQHLTGRSLSVKNRSTLKHVTLPQAPAAVAHYAPHFDAPPPPSSSNSRDSRIEAFSADDGLDAYRVEIRKVRSGPIERVVGERSSRRREWMPCFFFLSTAHLLVYKDERSAEKHGKHYEAPLLACDLRGASVSWLHEKEKRKRKVFQLELSAGAGPPLILRAASDLLTEQWFESLREVIAQLPSSSTGPSSADPTAASAHPPFSLVRNPSAVSIARPQSAYNVSRSSKRDTRLDPMCMSAVESGSGSTSADATPSRESIIERLKRFFRTRPSVESLKEKGIYKPEPVFGSTLAAICQLENSLVPRFIQVVTELIESKGLEVDGLYRVSGNLSAVQKIRCQVDQNRYQLLVSEEDVHVLTGALKLFFRELAEPVFPSKMTKDFLSAMQVQNPKQRFKRFDELLKVLPVENKETLKLLLRHLQSVAKNADKNRMQIHNLAIMFGPTLFNSGCDEPRPKKKGEKDKKAKKGKEDAPVVQSNSHLAFNMIMQGQIVEYLLNEGPRFEALQGPVRLQP